MVSSSSRAILKSLSRRLDTLLEIRRVLAEAAERMAERVAEDGLDYLEDLAPEEQLRELEKYAAAREYGDNINELETEIAVLKRCVSLAQKAVAGRNDAKFVKLLEVIDEFRVRENDPGLKFIIFTEFVETQQYLKSCLESLGYATALINGGMSPQEKQE